MITSWIGYLPAGLRSRFEHRHYVKQIVGNSAWLFADKLVRMGVGLIVGVWIARYLGPGQFGQLSYAIAFVALFNAFATLGMDGIVMRDLVRYPEKKSEILGSVFALKLTGGGVALLLAFAVIWFLQPGDTKIHWMVGIIAAGMVFQAFDVADLWFQAKVQSRFTVVAKNTAFLVLAAVKVCLILRQADVVAFAWAGTAEIALGALGLFVAFQLSGNSWTDFRPLRVRMTALLKECWPLLFSGVAVMLYMRIDQVMLAEMVGEREVGLYSAALRLSEVWYVIPTIIVGSTMPYLTEMRAKSEELYYQRLQQLFTHLVRIACIVGILLTFGSSPLIYFLYGESYSQAAAILTVHIWAGMFVFLGVAAVPWAVNEGATKFALYQTSLGAITNIALNLYLIPLYGAIGCAFATTISYAISAWISNSFFPETRKLFKKQSEAIFNALNIFKGRLSET